MQQQAAWRLDAAGRQAMQAAAGGAFHGSTHSDDRRGQGTLAGRAPVSWLLERSIALKLGRAPRAAQDGGKAGPLSLFMNATSVSSCRCRRGAKGTKWVQAPLWGRLVR